MRGILTERFSPAANPGSREKSIGFLVEQKSYKKRPHLFARVRDSAENEIEAPQGEKHNYKRKLRSVALNGGLSMAMFKKHR